MRLFGVAVVLALVGCSDSASEPETPTDADTDSTSSDTADDTSSGDDTATDAELEISVDAAETSDDAVASDSSDAGVDPVDSTADVVAETDGAPTWSAEETFVLALPAATPPVSYSLGKTALSTTLGADAKTLQLLLLDTSPIVTNALATLKTACGTGWQLDVDNPTYDCSGKGFVGPDGTWKTSPEFTLIRWLTTTPANTVVDGTSWQSLKDVATSLGIGGGYQQLVADTLGIPRTKEIWSVAKVTDAITTRFVGSHPAAPGGKLPITVDDVLHDLVTMSAKFGPVAGGHPGVLDPATPPKSVIAGPTFAVSMSGPSNLVTQDGIELGKGKASFTILEDTTGPTYDDPVELDLAATALTTTGLAAAPTVDLRFAIGESASFVKSCTGSCASNTPTTPYGTTYVWSTPAWQEENLLAYAARNEYLTRAGYDKCYSLCSLEAKVGYSPSPAGFAQWTTVAGIGSPPADAYLGEALMEIGEGTLHRIRVGGATTYLAEGNARLAFTASSVPVSVTSAQLDTAIAPALSTHRAALDKAAAGAWSAKNANVDLYLHAGLQLWFPIASDPRPAMTYPYAHVGFYDDEALTTLASTKTVSGTPDTSHEKLALAVGTRTVYVEGADGATYRLRITVDAASTVSVAVSKKS